MKRIILSFLLLLSSAITQNVLANAAASPKGIRNQQRLESMTDIKWPSTGIEFCKFVLPLDFKSACMNCFEDGGSSWKKARECICKWMPKSISKCSSKTSELEFEYCLVQSYDRQQRINKRAQALIVKGGKGMRTVGDSKIIDDGPAAIYSSMAQELIFSSKEIESVMGVAAHCFDDYTMDEENTQWHLIAGGNHWEWRKNNRKHQYKKKQNKKSIGQDKIKEGRNIVYTYGDVGHDMPFHGVGPLAVDVLKGKCIYQSLIDAGEIDFAIETIFDKKFPVPAWLFRFIMDEITSINIP